jgi:hypothetical protein
MEDRSRCGSFATVCEADSEWVGVGVLLVTGPERWPEWVFGSRALAVRGGSVLSEMAVVSSACPARARSEQPVDGSAPST